MKKWQTLGILVLIVMVLTGCANNTALPKIEQIKEKKTLVLGTSADYPPFEWHLVRDGKDEVVGFDIALANHIADKLGVELVIEDMNFDSLIAALKTGKVDMVMAGMTPTEKRQKEVDFTKLYHQSQFVALVRKEDAANYTTTQQLSTAQIGVQKGTAQETIAQQLVDVPQLTAMPKNDALVLALETEKVDAVIVDQIVADAYVKSHPTIAISQIVLPQEEGGSAVAVKKGEEALLQFIQTELDTLQQNGQFEKWMIEYTDLASQ